MMDFRNPETLGIEGAEEMVKMLDDFIRDTFIQVPHNKRIRVKNFILMMDIDGMPINYISPQLEVTYGKEKEEPDDEDYGTPQRS
jgi:hypothetical protein